MSAPEKVRLHISPLTPESYAIVVPASLHDSVSEVSYHQIPTFPEKNFGYIELPAAEAERLKKRLNGALVKGAKVKVEIARPKKVVDYEQGGVTNLPVAQIRQKTDLNGSSEEVIRGVRLPDSRRVRRGWTEVMAKKTTRKDKNADSEPAKKSRVKRSEFTDKEELLFKTKIKTGPTKDEGKKRKRDDDATIVHEFKQTTKFPSFLRGQNAEKSKSTAEYDPEKGWVDEDGNMVEGPRRSRRKHSDATSKADPSAEKFNKATTEVTKAAKKLSIQTTKSKPQPKPPVEMSVDDETSSSGSSDSSEAEDEDSEEDDELPQSRVELTKDKHGPTQENEEPDNEARGDTNPTLTVETTPKPEAGIPSLEIQPESAVSEKEVHPLEALFKKPKGGSKKPHGLELKIPAFSFFGNAEDDESEDGDVPTALPLLPQTPFTQADMRFRRERSAAPTPDTAAPTKLLFGPVMDKPLPTSQSKDKADDSSDDDDEEAEDEALEDGGPSDIKGRSEFAEKWFWENRGDNNRAWKKRRREVTKQKRYEGNKRRTRSSAG